MRKRCVSGPTAVVFILLASASTANVTLGAEDQIERNETERIEPADVFQRVQILKAEVELIREEVGGPKAAPPFVSG